MANTNVDMKGRVVMVTGATNGIGLATVEALARMGATVVCVGRDPVRTPNTVEALKAKTGNPNLEAGLCDFSSLASIRAYAAEFKRSHPRLHVLVNNAGAINQFRETSKDGYELTFAVNHLGYFLLTRELLDVLKASAPARIVNVASEAERYAPGMNFDDLMYERTKYRPFAVYAQSKLANLMFTYELAKRLEGTGVTVNALHPGGVGSNFAGNAKGIGKLAWMLFKPFALTPAQGAETSVWLASAPEVEGVTGKYWAKRKELQPRRAVFNAALRERLWKVSEELVAAR